MSTNLRVNDARASERTLARVLRAVELLNGHLTDLTVSIDGVDGTLDVSDAASLVQLQLINLELDALTAAVGLLPTDGATEATLQDLLTKTSADPATQTTLAAILAKLIVAPATEAKQLPDNHQVTVSNPTADPETGLAKSANQLPDGHNVAVNNFPATQPVSGTVTVANPTTPTSEFARVLKFEPAVGEEDSP